MAARMAGTASETHVLAKSRLASFVAGLGSVSEVWGPTKHGGNHAFRPLPSPEALVLNYVVTVLPPRKLVMPPRETLLRFSLGDGKGQAEPVLEASTVTLFGVHPCDLQALKLLDQAFLDRHQDGNYLRRRLSTVLIGVDCMPDEYCFCSEVGTLAPSDNYDLFLTDVGDSYAVSIGTSRGADLLEEFAVTEPATEDHLAAIVAHRFRKREAICQRLEADASSLPLLFTAVYDSPLWEKISDPCLSCGSCNLVCPTCYCFDVRDRVAVDLKSGHRERVWDACLLSSFALVATGENFRPKRHERLRHRMHRKYKYLPERYATIFCTGCGRCARACLVHIHPVEVINTLARASFGGNLKELGLGTREEAKSKG